MNDSMTNGLVKYLMFKDAQNKQANKQTKKKNTFLFIQFHKTKGD